MILKHIFNYFDRAKTENFSNRLIANFIEKLKILTKEKAFNKKELESTLFILKLLDGYLNTEKGY